MLLTVLFVIGITAEGVTGALAAGRQKMDLFGVLMIAEMTALGGGTARDVLLGHYPLTWVRHPEYLLVVATAAVLAISIHPIMNYFRKVFLALDAVGLAAFSVIGANVAIEMGHGYLIALVAATVTGVFGGILRDIFCNRIPLVFRTELYASIVLAGVTVYWLLREAGVDEQIGTVVTLVVIFGTRMLALRFRWSLPVFEYQEREYRRRSGTQIWASARKRVGLHRPLRHRRREGHGTGTREGEPGGSAQDAPPSPGPGDTGDRPS